MSKVLIGLPIYKRAWIAPYWLQAIEKQSIGTENLGFIFEFGQNDKETQDILWAWHSEHPEISVFDGNITKGVTHKEHREGTRMWNPMRYYHMVYMRNSLLDRATAMSDQFDYYFSLDSDIILSDTETIDKLISKSEDNPGKVISPLTQMMPKSEKNPNGTAYPSIMSWKYDPGGIAYRRDDYPIGTSFDADIVMAAVFMPKEIFTQVRYIQHKQGEDLGFAAMLSKYNFGSIAASDINADHIMHRYMLNNKSVIV